MTEARAAMHSPGIPRRTGAATAPVIVVGLDGSPTSWDAVSYTHLDVYKRQVLKANPREPARAGQLSIPRQPAKYIEI